jgi:hypothetical protein
MSLEAFCCRYFVNPSVLIHPKTPDHPFGDPIADPGGSNLDLPEVARRVGWIGRAVMVAHNKKQTNTMLFGRDSEASSYRVTRKPVGRISKKKIRAGLGDHVHVVHFVVTTDVFLNGTLHPPIDAVNGCCKSAHVP